MVAFWTACGPDGDTVCLMQMAGRDLRAVRSFATPEAALDAALGPVLRIGMGAPVTVPAPVVPDRGRDLPGLTQVDPPDRLDGWTRLALAGFLSGHRDWDGVICVAGCGLSHWVQVSAGEAVSFQSFLTGRLISVLGGGTTAAPDAVADSISRPERLAAHLRRADITGRPEAITGHLIGAELAAARPYWLGRLVAVIGDAPPQVAALALQGVPAEVAATGAMRAAGLAAVGDALGLTGHGGPAQA